MEGGFVFDGEAACCGGVEGLCALDVLKGEADGAVKDAEVECLVIELELERTVDKGEAWVGKDSQVVEGLDFPIREVGKNASQCSAERTVGIAWGEGFEAFGIAAEDTTDEADEGFALPGEKAWQELEQFAIARRGKAVERLDGLAEEGGVVEALAPIGPEGLPVLGNAGLGSFEELVGEEVTLAGG